jgi:hypothetical protein
VPREMISFPEDQIAELKLLCPDVAQFEEASSTYLPLPGLCLPEGCKPARTDALLCPCGRDGYPSRLFFAEKVECRGPLNWNASGVRIGERNWHAFSWKTASKLRLAQIVAVHLKALR